MRGLIALIIVAGSWQLAAGQSLQPELPRLLVIVVADQMRADHILTFQHRWKRGFRVLLDQGAYFPRAEFPYLNNVTCAGHATIGTGSFPRTHGIVLNGWWNRNTGRYENCMDDPAAAHVSYGRPAPFGSSGNKIVVPTLADELRARQPDARVAVMGLKPRSTIPLAGRTGVVTWFDDIAGSFVTARPFSAEPVKQVRDFIASDPVEKDLGRVWALQDREATYRFSDVGVGERPTAGWTALFPHPIEGRTGADAQFFERWQKSPFSDAYLGRMAASLVDSMQLGQRTGTDYLAVAFAALDMMGHDFGPRSREVEDLLMHLDAALGALIQRLDDRVGRDRYVLALTGDHGVAPIPEQVQTGRLATEDIQQAAENVLVAQWGVPAGGRYVENVALGHVYFASGVYERLRNDAPTLRAVERALVAMPGVSRVLRGDRLSAASDDPAIRAAAYSYYPGRSGQLIVMPKPYWVVELRADSEATEHGTMYSYDRRVPLFLLGNGIRKGRFAARASPADVAPTLASLAGIPLPKAEGRVLREALK
ncbi:MAG TPA: alkaline phosphatase family protein [Vicinamibacterales bacterium]